MSRPDEEAIPRVFTCMPTTGICHSLAALFYHCNMGRVYAMKGVAEGSNLTKLFNQAWAEALNKHRDGIVDYFLLHHADIEVRTMSWLQEMVKIMQAGHGPVLSVVQMIKDQTGDTSTAVECRDPKTGIPNLWGPRRLTLQECHELGPTFTTEDCKKRGIGYPLLINTGLLLIDLNRPEWMGIREEQGGLFFKFHMEDEIREGPSGYLRPRSQTEDWDFSRRCAIHNIPVWATTAIVSVHHGDQGWMNQMEEVSKP